MPHINGNRRNPAGAAKPAAAAVLVLLLACLGLAACGGSSKSSSTSANAAATSSTAEGARTGPTGPRAGRFQALRECLQKNGITLPKRTPGQRPGGGAGGFLGGGAGGPRLPAGVTRAQYEAAVRKCGGAAFVGAGNPIRSPAVKQAVAKFAKCMRENGVNVPEPNTSGNGPIFNTKGLNTTSAQFKTAETTCSSYLRSAFRRGPSAGGPPVGPGGTAGPTGGKTGGTGAKVAY
jgi:hypothetical protein